MNLNPKRALVSLLVDLTDDIEHARSYDQCVKASHVHDGDYYCDQRGRMGLREAQHRRDLVLNVMQQCIGVRMTKAVEKAALDVINARAMRKEL